MDINPFWFSFFPELEKNTIRGHSNDHVAMYIGNGKFLESIDYTGFLFFKKNGIQETNFLLFYIWANNFTLYRVKDADLNEKQRAVSFAENHIGDLYQWAWPKLDNFQSWYANPNITDENNPFYFKYYFPEDSYINHWTCAEIVWAAYLHQMIQIDSTPKTEDGEHYFVSCDDIKNSINVTKIID